MSQSVVMNPYSSDFIDFLEPFVSEERREKIDRVIEERCASVPIVLEGLYDLGNINAVMRSAEALGYYHLHLIKKSDEFRVANRVTQGADRWLDIQSWSQVNDCASALRAKGFRLAVTDMTASLSIDEINFCEPIAVVFGNEKEGISEEMRKAADLRFVVPMSGFSQSFNISVAAAICLKTIQSFRIRRQGFHGDLTPAQKKEVRQKYYLNSVSRPDDLQRSFKNLKARELKCQSDAI